MAREHTVPLSSGVIAESTLTLLIEPMAYGRSQFIGGLIGRGMTHTYFDTSGHGPMFFGAANGTTAAASTSGTNVNASLDYSREYSISGNTSIKVRPLKNDGTANVYVDLQAEGLTTGDIYARWIVKSSDGSLPDVSLYNNGTVEDFAYNGASPGPGEVAADYWHMGNGWYLITTSKSVTISGVYNFGLAFNSYDTVWIGSHDSGLSVGYPYPGRHEDATANDSGSTINSRISVPREYILPSSAKWSLKADLYYAHKDTAPITGYLIQAEATEKWPRITIDYSSGLLVSIYTNTGVYKSATLSAALGDSFSIVVTVDGTDIKLYEDGVEVSLSTTGTTVVPAASSHYSIGPLFQTLVLGLTTWDITLTATQVAALHGLTSGIASDYLATDTLPYLWSSYNTTNIGVGDIFQNESTGNYTPWGVLGGLVGDSADIEMILQSSSTLSAAGFVVGGVSADYGDIDRSFYNDVTAGALFVAGTGTADTASYNNACEQSSVNTSAVEFVNSGVDSRLYRACAGKTLSALVVVKDAGSNLQLRLKASFGSSDIYTPWRSVSAPSAYYSFLLGSIRVPDKDEILESELKLGFAIEARRTTSGAANLNISHMCVMESPLIIEGSGMTTPADADAVLIRGREVVALDYATSSNDGIGRPTAPPNPLRVVPNQQALLFFWGVEDGKQYNPAITTSVKSLRYRPIWRIV